MRFFFWVKNISLTRDLTYTEGRYHHIHIAALLDHCAFPKKDQHTATHSDYITRFNRERARHDKKRVVAPVP